MSTRKFSRVNFKVDATIKTAERQFHGDVKDLSMSGLFMLTGERLQQGDPVEITIILTGTVPEIFVNFSGEVSRITENGIGFTFKKMDLDSYTHLKNIVAYNSDDAEKVVEEIHHSIDERLATET
ncbi:MAG: PilZ domain-containing protein [Geobacteraceae bacterium]|nr:PilZ domain-containing protein [Geobacteraceae bacterium]